jgi:LuxR family maltose regulon positive regulatory protein
MSATVLAEQHLDRRSGGDSQRRVLMSAQRESVVLEEAQVEWLLPTKLAAPPARPALVPRPRLLARLDDGLRGPLTVVAAPAGFGKTTLLAEWRATAIGASARLAWVSLDAGDNDPVRFWSYVLAGLRAADVEVSQAAQVVQQSSGAPPEAIALAVARDLNGLRADLVLVLDDYHLIESEAIHRGLAFLLEHLPPCLHLVVLSRTEPGLPVARLRARGQLVEIGARQLRFDADEVAAFLGDTMGLTLPAEVAEALGAATEGWVAGLQLAALALEGQDEPADFLARFSGGHRYVLDYLVEEVLYCQPAPVQAFLLRTSILGRLSGELCDAVTGEAGGQTMLEWLERANLFLVPLDGEQRWYRYHHLFGEALRHRLKTAGLDCAALHARAAAWFEREGLASEAVEHSLAGRNWPQAMRRMEPLVAALTERGERPTIDRWLAAVPEEALLTSARFTLFRAWTHLYDGQLDAAERLGLAAAARAEEVDDVPAQGRAGQLQSLLAITRGDGATAIEHGRRGFALLPTEDRVRRGAALLGAGVGHMLVGELTEAAATLERSAALTFAVGDALISGILALTQLGHVRGLQGDLVQAERLYREALQRGGETTIFTRARALVRLGDLLREQGQLDQAAELLEAGVSLEQRCGGLYLHEGYISLARLRGARGELAGALESSAEAEAAARRIGHRTAGGRARAYAIRLHLAAGNLPAVERWAAAWAPDDDALLGYEREVEALTLARVWITLGRHTDALDLLARLRPPAEAAGRVASEIEMLIVQALAWHARGDEAAALASLGEALVRAEPCGNVRLFVDEGAPLAAMLETLAAGQRRGALAGPSASPGYLRRLLAAFGGRAQETLAGPAAVAVGRTWSLVEPLSTREQEVLRLMATGAANQQIADRLVVAITTVKTHVNGIFRKLDAASRIEAVARARELGVLER